MVFFEDDTYSGARAIPAPFYLISRSFLHFLSPAGWQKRYTPNFPCFHSLRNAEMDGPCTCIHCGIGLLNQSKKGTWHLVI